MNVFVVVVKDNHIDLDVQVFGERSVAIAHARERANANARHPEDIQEQELDQEMVKDRWVFFCVYSVEDDNVRVVQRTVGEVW